MYVDMVYVWVFLSGHFKCVEMDICVWLLCVFECALCRWRDIRVDVVCLYMWDVGVCSSAVCMYGLNGHMNVCMDSVYCVSVIRVYGCTMCGHVWFGICAYIHVWELCV